MSDIPIIELSGSPEEMGEAFGEAFKEETRQLTESRIENLIRFIGRHAPDRAVSRRSILESIGRTVAAHESFDAAIWSEFCGIARAADLAVEELLIGNGYTDLRDIVLFAGPADAPSEHTGECSAFLVPADLARDHRPIVGQTWDMTENTRPFLVLVRRKPIDAPETVCLTTTGCLCLIGMNSEGVAVGNTNLIPTDARPGVNYLFAITRALTCSSAEDAIYVIERTPRASGHFFYAADGNTALNIETTAARTHRTVVEDGVFVHTNHYLSDELRRIEFVGKWLENTRWRYQKLGEKLGELSPPLELETCSRQLAAVTQDKVEVGTSLSSTLATVGQCPGEGTLMVWAGGADEGDPTVLSV